eukprot:7356725-Prymnesium_polylepis.1
MPRITIGGQTDAMALEPRRSATCHPTTRSPSGHARRPRCARRPVVAIVVAIVVDRSVLLLQALLVLRATSETHGGQR